MNNQSQNTSFIFLDLGQNGQCLLSVPAFVAENARVYQAEFDKWLQHRPSMITGLLRRTAQRHFASTARKPLWRGSINMFCRIPRSKHSAFQRFIFNR